MRKSAPPAASLWTIAGLGTTLLWLLAPWPVAQAVLHGAVVVAVLPLLKAPLSSGLWALAAGWVVDLSLRVQPHPGGTPWADLTLVLFLRWAVRMWPPPDRAGYVVRLLGGLLLHGLLQQLALTLANGPHAWGTAWLWAVAAGLAWGVWGDRLFRAYWTR